MTGKLVAFISAGIALTAALWLEFRPQHGGFVSPFPAVAAIPADEMPPMGRDQRVPVSPVHQEVFEIDIRGGKISGSPLLRVHEGDEVTLKIISDGGDEVHLHGYDLHAQLMPGETATLAFTATQTGRFGMEMHRSHAELGALEVYPR